MNSQRWAQVHRLFDQAVDLPEAERIAFLNEQCGDDAELRIEVEAMLAADSGEVTLLDPINAAVVAYQSDEGRDFGGRQLGSFVLKRLLGLGGMGAVYLAEREDGDFNQKVAIKLLRIHNKELAGRLADERRILGQLRHPYIAQLHDSGETDDGLPYLVMEYVEGISVDKFCAEQKLTTAQKLRLFKKICDAVHYAHRHLVVHRDLKPSNILVTRDGLPKLLDFGIAKINDPYRQETEATQLGHQAWTPSYATPEQIRGMPISTATDMYALGLVLYRLLTGNNAQPVAELSVEESIRHICEQQPPAPSQVAGVSGDLDRIVFRALHKDPAQRYASVAALSDDIDRYLEGMPVQAAGDDLIYRLRKFVQRHKAAVGMGVLAMLVVCVAAVSVIQDRARALAAEAEAVAQLDRANSITDFLLDIFRAGDIRHRDADEITPQDLLDKAYADIQADASLEPAIRVDLMIAIGHAYGNSGIYDTATEVFQAALEQLQEMPDRIKRAQVLSEMGHNYYRGQETVSARAPLEEALAIQLEELPADAVHLADTLNHLGVVLSVLGEYQQAKVYLEQSLQIRQQRQQPSSRVMAASMHNLALVHYHLAEDSKALEYMESSLAIKRPQLGDEHVDMGNGLVLRAQILRQLDRLEESGENFRQALTIFENNYPAGHDQIVWVTGELAGNYHDLGLFDQAEQLYLELVELNESRQFGDELTHAISLNNLASLYEDTLQYQQAEPLFRKSLALRRENLGAMSVRTSVAYHNLGRLLRKRGQYVESEQLLQQAQAIQTDGLQPSHIRIQRTKIELALLAVDTGRLDRAFSDLQAVSTVFEADANISSSNRVRLNDAWREYWQAAGDMQQAAGFARQVYDGRLQVLGSKHPFTQRARQIMDSLL